MLAHELGATICRMPNIYGVRTQQPAIGPVLQRWVKMMLEPWPGNDDAPWWYNERASLSQLAGAIWGKGGWVFEEYRASKKYEGADYPGRVDFMFEWRTVKLVAGAKQLWVPLNGSLDLAARVAQKLKDARADAERAPDVRGTYARAGIVFVVPHASDSLVADESEYQRRSAASSPA